MRPPPAPSATCARQRPHQRSPRTGGGIGPVVARAAARSGAAPSGGRVGPTPTRVRNSSTPRRTATSGSARNATTASREASARSARPGRGRSVRASIGRGRTAHASSGSIDPGRMVRASGSLTTGPHGPRGIGRGSRSRSSIAPVEVTGRRRRANAGLIGRETTGHATIARGSTGPGRIDPAAAGSTVRVSGSSATDPHDRRVIVRGSRSRSSTVATGRERRASRSPAATARASSGSTDHARTVRVRRASIGRVRMALARGSRSVIARGSRSPRSIAIGRVTTAAQVHAAAASIGPAVSGHRSRRPSGPAVGARRSKVASNLAEATVPVPADSIAARQAASTGHAARASVAGAAAAGRLVRASRGAVLAAVATARADRAVRSSRTATIGRVGGATTRSSS